MFLLSTQKNLCIMLNSYVVKGMCKKIQVWISCLQLASRPPKCGCFLENILGSYFGNHFQAEIVPYSPLFFYFQTVFHMVWENQESWVLGFFWVIGIQKCKIFSSDKFFFVFLSCHYGFMNCFEILNFVFSNIISGGVWTCKILTF